MMSPKFWELILLIITSNVIISYSNETSNNSKMDENLNKLAIANNYLGLKLYQIMAKGSPGNIFFSPFSLSNACGMLYTGAKGNTAKELRSALGYNAAKLISNNVPSAFNQYIEMVLPKNQSSNSKYDLNLANELLLANDFQIYPEYINQVQNNFHAYIKEVDFENNSAQIVKEVNTWVNEQTHGEISKLLSDLSPSTVLLILNAIYFKGTWKTQFDMKMTKSQNFYNDGSNSKAKKAPLMHVTENFPYAYDGDLQALELPYKGDNVSMIVLLPQKRNGLANLESSITPQKIQDLQKRMYSTKVIVTFPKFKVEYSRTMNSDFKTLGAKDMFKPDSANFSDITPKKGIYVSDIVHKAAVEVNEEGSEAAAATAIGFRFIAPAPPPPPPEIFTADHPFMYAIIDKRNDLILFLGRVTEL